MKKLYYYIVLAVAVSSHGITVAQTEKEYKAVSINYVDLSDNAKVSANPIITKALSNKLIKGSTSVIQIKLDDIINSNLSGIGGAFNEQGGEAFMSLDTRQQKKLVVSIFNTEEGFGFSQCRTAIGASDFGLSAYSYSETTEDYEMKHFSVARDEKTVIPFIKAAYAENPALQMFASPWSPPGWMKKSGKMDGGNENVSTNKLIDDPKIYNAYALYFTKYIQEYVTLGVKINRLIIQNETDMNPKYPGCDMSSEQMSELVINYIRPAFKEAKIATELWAGSFRGKRHDAQAFMTLEGAKVVDGVGLQYCGSKDIIALNKDYPKMKFMHTEGKCYNGDNTMEQARSRFSEVAMWLNGGCENYCYWNMILNEESKSAWGWKQNSMITIDRQTKKITYNPDYAPMALFSKFIQPGDQTLNTFQTHKMDVIAVSNKEHLVVFLQNDTEEEIIQNIKVENQNFTVELPVKSLCAFLFKVVK